MLTILCQNMAKMPKYGKYLLLNLLMYNNIMAGRRHSHSRNLLFIYNILFFSLIKVTPKVTPLLVSLPNI